MILTFRYRLLPTKRQHRALEAILEAQRQLYNAALEERIGAYRNAGVSRTCFDQFKALTEWRKSDPEATQLPVALQRWTVKRVDGAYQAFFRRVECGANPGFPRFRGKGRFDTFGFRQFCGIQFSDNRVVFKGMPGSLRVHVHRPMPPGVPIRSCVFHRDVKGWTIGFAVRMIDTAKRTDHQTVGVDLGISIFAALSDGGFIPSLNAARRAQRRVRVAQRALARKVRGSNSRRKARHHLASLHGAIYRARLNHLHQASARLVRDYRVVVVEKLNVKGLARSALAKDVHDASWAEFLSMLRYKAECAGSRIVEVNPGGTSQECSGCGSEVPKTLSDRQHRCFFCGLIIDRDLNAARNILNRAGVRPGLRNVAEKACVQAETSMQLV